MVVDSKNHRVQVFTADGKLLKMFWNTARTCDGLRYPTAVAVDANDLVYVSEGYDNRISVFSPNYEFLTSFRTTLNTLPQFLCRYHVFALFCSSCLLCLLNKIYFSHLICEIFLLYILFINIINFALLCY